MPPKRKAAAPTKQAIKGKGKAKQPKQDGQKAISRDIDIPIDEGFHEDGEVLSFEAQASVSASDMEDSKVD